MLYYNIVITYPNAQEETIDQEFLSLRKAIEYANHILGQVNYNAKFHGRSIDADGNTIKVQPYCLITEITEAGSKVVFDTRNQ